jgi:predicted unusual protein kinase regulating ubiquinone biosynthesis (AarF/ABC1/UbiB family)
MRTQKDKIRLKRRSKTLKALLRADLEWVSPIAREVHENAELFAKVVSSLLVTLSKQPDFQQKTFANIRKSTLSQVFLATIDETELLTELQAAFRSFSEHLSSADLSFLESDEFTANTLSPAIKRIAKIFEKNPRLIPLLFHAELLENELGALGKRLSQVIRFLPLVSSRAASLFPEIREQCFEALFRLGETDRERLAQFAERLTRGLFEQFAIPKLKKILENDPKGKVILPFLHDVLKLIPAESSLNALVSIVCTPKEELSVHRLISIAIRELGGLYLKTAQVLSEMCPPNLARELRSSQDAAGGVFPSVEKSFAHLLTVLNENEVRNSWQHYLELPDLPCPHFAAASVGAIYELRLNAQGREKYGVETVLVKIQRPALKELLEIQAAQLTRIASSIRDNIVADSSLGSDLKQELTGMCDALMRGIQHYFQQCSAELDFRREQENADIIRASLKENSGVVVPRYFHTHPKYLLMERMRGIKVTRSVQTKYLERREIADRLIRSYLSLLFDRGIVWADPHPGNILLDDRTLTVSMIDLNPCFIWESDTREQFKSMLYRLMLRDVAGLLDTLYSLVGNPEALHNNKLFDELTKLMSADVYKHGTAYFIADVMRLLAENGIDLRIEVQAAMRGLTQLAITATSISARNSFALELRKYFGLRDIVNTIFDVGLLRVFRVSTAIIFQHIQQSPVIEIGPTLDERDLRTLARRLLELRSAGVCEIRFRRVSPEEHANLRQTPDGLALIVSSDLQLAILDKIRPAQVRYIIELPSSYWLRERQEFVKLTSFARNFAIIECLEQLRRKSLDDYWRTVEAWNKPAHQRTVNELGLIGEVKIAARRLFQLRFSQLWDNPLSGLGKSSRLLWRILLALEMQREYSEQKFVELASKTKAHLPVASLAVGTVHRMRILMWEALLRFTRWRLSKHRFSMSLLPIGIDELESIVLHNLGRANSPSRRNGSHPRKK